MHQCAVRKIMTHKRYGKTGRTHAGAHRIPLVDYFLAAAAQQLGAAVIHYDRDYDTLAEVMEFESVWLAPAGTIA